MTKTRASSLKRAMGTFLILLCIVTPACKKKMSKQEIVQKSESIKTKQELERVLGKPDEYQHLAKLERWIYHGSDGDVTFHVVGDRVMFSDTLSESGESGDQDK
ncbi:MAG: hypothetical protein U0166_10640 [Acidobacteriota bacterium]